MVFEYLKREVYRVQFSSVVSDSLRPRGLQHARPPYPSPTARVYPNPCPLSQWCHPTISSSVVPFSSCPQSFPASGSFQMSQLFASGGQNIGVSASTSVLPMNTQDWSPLGWTGWISLQSTEYSWIICWFLIFFSWFFWLSKHFSMSTVENFWYGQRSIIKKYSFPPLTYRFNTIPVKIHAIFFPQNWQDNSKMTHGNARDSNASDSK